jgi:type IX secretion system PorP/SprF family membrane protein
MVMVKHLQCSILVAFLLLSAAYCQESDYGPGYQTIMNSNPAFSGSEGDGIIRMSYLNFYPGNNYNLHSFFISYDTYVTGLHGGTCIWLSNDYLGGIINDLRGGLSYSYHLRADRNFFIDAGLSASFYHRGLNRSNVILPDQIDALSGSPVPSGETLTARGRTVFDVGVGFLFIAGKYLGSFSLTHLARPDLSPEGASGAKLDRKATVHLSGSFQVNEKNHLELVPVFYGELQGNRLHAGIGGTFGSPLLSVNSILLINSAKDLNLQSGLSLQKGTFRVYYSYRFNISSGNQLLPASLLHQAGLVISVKKVDKRKIIKTINIPKL